MSWLRDALNVAVAGGGAGKARALDDLSLPGWLERRQVAALRQDLAATGRREMRTVGPVSAPRSFSFGTGPGANLRARGLLIEDKMAELRRRHGPPRGGGGGCGKGCLIIAIPVIAIFILGLVLTLSTRLG